MECLNSNMIDTMLIMFTLFGMAAGIIIGAVWVDNIHKSRKELP